MTAKELIAEVTSSFKQYEESNLIDQRSVKLWLKNALKGFGSPIMVLSEKVLDVLNGSTDLPDDFWSLSVAVKCDIDGYKSECKDKTHLSRSSRWTQRIENTYVWDNGSNQHVKEDYKEIIQREYIDENNSLYFRYGNLQPLTLTRGIKKEYIGANCKNRLFNKSQYEINIIGGNKLQTNFNKGYVYLLYNALPTDEQGNLFIPDSDKLIEYLQYHLKKKILEDIWLNGDDTGLEGKVSYLSQKEAEYKSLATTQLKFEALGKNWAKKLKSSMVRDTEVYNRMFPIL